MATIYNTPSARIIPTRSNNHYKPIWVLAKESNALGCEVRHRWVKKIQPVPVR